MLGQGSQGLQHGGGLSLSQRLLPQVCPCHDLFDWPWSLDLMAFERPIGQRKQSVMRGLTQEGGPVLETGDGLSQLSPPITLDEGVAQTLDQKGTIESHRQIWSQKQKVAGRFGAVLAGFGTKLQPRRGLPTLK